MTHKRLKATVTGIICSSIICGVAIWKVPAEAIIELMKGYFMLIGGLLGAYAGLQSATDCKLKPKK